MPPKKATTTATKPKPTAKSTVTKTKAVSKESPESAKAAKPPRLTKAQANKAKVEAKIAEGPSSKAAPAKSAKRKAESSDEEEDDEDDEEPVSKKVKTSDAKSAPTKAPITKKAAAPKKAGAAPKKQAAKPAPKTAKKAVVAQESSVEESESDEEEEPEPIVKAPKKAAAPKKPAAPRKIAVPKTAKALPTINEAPTQILDVYVFGEGSAGELGLGAVKGPDGKKVIDVTRPRLNPKLSAENVGVVALAVGGMHCVALTKDNKILTWGVNDQGALGRETPQEGKMKEVDQTKEEDSSSDSDDDDDDSGLNPNESEPREVDTSNFASGDKFAAIFAGDSTSWAVTTTGIVYGWGTFRSNDGILGFRENIHTQKIPMKIPELKKIKTMAVGTNHVLALDDRGKTTIWGAGEQGQLARRVVARTAKGGLVPREFGLQRKKIVVLGAGDYHSFAVDDKGNVYSWGLNTFGQTGVPKSEETEENTVGAPTLVASLTGFDVKQITGGAHHTLACTEDGKVLIWGRMDTNQGGMEFDKMDKDSLFFDEHKKPRFYTRPATIPDIEGEFIATANDTCIAVDKSGKAFSWGFSSNYQTGQGSDNDVTHATHIDNSAVRGKKLVFAGLGGQFGVVAGVAGEVAMANGA